MNIKELRELVISALVIALAFGIAMSGGLQAFKEPAWLLRTAGFALVGVSTGFVLHELAHRMVARRFGYIAEYKMWPAGLGIALISGLMGFIFAAPGAVVIRPGNIVISTRQAQIYNIGLISLAGPATNITLALVFLLADQIHPHLLFYIGAYINTWLGLFNLIPFGPLDGAKIFLWNKKVWGAAMATAGGLYLLQRFVLG
jgi:Zn-dependent protease